MLTESRQVATPSISSSLSRSCWIAVPSRASRPCKRISRPRPRLKTLQFQTFLSHKKNRLKAKCFHLLAAAIRSRFLASGARRPPQLPLLAPSGWFSSLMFRSTSSFQTYLTRALKSSLRFSCSTASSFNSLRVASKADSA